MATVNRQITLASRPVGVPRVSDFNLVGSPLPSSGADEVLVRSVYLSLDPYMRGRMSDAESYAPPVAIAAPKAFIGMLQGKNQGKQLVQLSEP